MSELIYDGVFAAFAGLTVVSALLVVLLRNLLHAAVSLFFCLTGVAALYVLLSADFLAVTQLLVYAGGILVLIIFGVFLTARIYEMKFELQGERAHLAVGGLIALSVFGLIAKVVSSTPWNLKETITHQPSARALGTFFLTKYLLPFELISILLLFVMVGAVLLVRKELPGREN